MPKTTIEIVTADAVRVAPGDRVYSHYTMSAGVIEVDKWFDGWFDLIHDDGKRSLLNGERICTLAHAHKMGWPNAS